MLLTEGQMTDYKSAALMSVIALTAAIIFWIDQ